MLEKKNEMKFTLINTSVLNDLSKKRKSEGRKVWRKEDETPPQQLTSANPQDLQRARHRFQHPQSEYSRYYVYQRHGDILFAIILVAYSICLCGYLDGDAMDAM